MRIRSSEQWLRIESVFSEALALPAGARASYLEQSCETDPDLRADVERLLAASEHAGEFLEALDTAQATRLLESLSDVGGSIGRYQVVRKIGSGGMGVVYLAEDVDLKRFVAVKLLPPWIHASAGANKRLLEEARAASAIDDPNIATVHEIGETEDGRLFITMSYYEGGTLRDRMMRAPVPVDTALDIGWQTARGLAAAHRKGIVHRDIKPENLLLLSDGRIKIVDFGLAKAGEAVSGQADTIAGTVAYMSPEHTLGAGLDARTDLWSLGIVLYEMLAGERPFRGTTEAIMASIRHDALEMNARIRNDIPASVRAIIERCLQKGREARYQSADELAYALQAVRSTVGHEGETPRTGRRPAALSIAVVAMLALAGGMASWRSRTAMDAGSPPVARAAERGSLAVLPFTALGADSTQEYLSDGITEELIATLASVEGMRVVARSSAFQFKGKAVDVPAVAARLGVAHVLEGSVEGEGSQLRITVRLAEAAHGVEVWSQVFTRPASDVFAMQADIARAVVGALQIEVDPREPVRVLRGADAAAYAPYLKGRHLFNGRRNLEQALRYFREAVAIDPEFAPAWAGLGMTWLVMPVYTAVPPVQARDSAELALRRALALDSLLAEAHAAVGSMRADQWRWAEAEREFRRALQLDGTDPTLHLWYGEMLVNLGRFDEAISQLNAANELDPLTSVIPSNIGWAYHSVGRHEEAIAAFRTALDFDPGFAYAHLGMGSSLLGLGRVREAVTEFETAVDVMKGQEAARSYLARGYARADRRVEAEQIFADLRRSALGGGGSAWGVAVVAAALGRDNDALTWLQVAYDRGEPSMNRVRMVAEFKRLQAEPRFVAILKKMGF